MVKDFSDLVSHQEVGYDLCIVGSGAASLAMISELLDTNMKVAILEAGGEDITDKNQEIYETINNIHPFPGSMDGRFRVFGGSTTRWGAQSLPLEKIDFVERDWVNNSGWPIRFDEVANYYPKVDRFLKLFPVQYSTAISTLNKNDQIKASSKISLKFSKWSATPNIRESLRAQIISSKNVTLFQNANVVNINLSKPGNNVTSLTCSNFEGKKVYFSAKKYILACGGIENARLLLSSNDENLKGIGNDQDLVGRYLQDHPNAYIATLYPNSNKAQKYFNYFYIRGTRFLPRFVFSEEFQRENLILNSSAYFSFVTKDDDLSAKIKELYRKYRRGKLAAQDSKIFFSLLKNIPELLKISYQYFIKGRVYTPNAVLELNLMTEAAPIAENRIVLSDDLDALGMPKAVISWQKDKLLQRTFMKCSEYLKAYFASLDFGFLEVNKWINEENWFDYIKDAKHHIGTTRMGNTEQEGVVDVNCKVFNVTNLYIAGSSVFPTSGHSNPTTTIIALAFRLVDYLKSNKDD